MFKIQRARKMNILKFENFLRKNNLSKRSRTIIRTIDKQNIVSVFFKFLVRNSDRKYRSFVEHMYLLKMYTTEMYLDMYEDDSKQEVIKELNEYILKMEVKKSILEINDNIEKELLNNYDFDKKILKDYFSYHKYYTKLASVFSTPFKQDDNYLDYYEFGYLLNMYINIDLYFNQYNVPDDFRIFNLKLDLQMKMINKLSEITPERFNSLIKLLNKWLNKYEIKKSRRIK